MSTEQFANYAQTSLTGSISAGATILTVVSATGFPASAQFRILIDNELMLVTSLGTSPFTTWTVTRSIEGTTAAAHSSGGTVTQVLTAGGLLNLPAFGASGSGHGPGTVPDPGSTAGTTRFLREDATWQVPAGGGSTSGAQVAARIWMGG